MVCGQASTRSASRTAVIVSHRLSMVRDAHQIAVIAGDGIGPQVIEQAIRYPGFSFVNVQSPCVTYGEDSQQVKEHKAKMKSLKSMGHDATDRLKAMALAQDYGRELYTGVFYRDPAPARELQVTLGERRPESQASRGIGEAGGRRVSLRP